MPASEEVSPEPQTVKTEPGWTGGEWRLGKHGSITGGEPRELANGIAYGQVALATLDACDGDTTIRDANAHLMANAKKLYEALDRAHIMLSAAKDLVGKHALGGTAVWDGAVCDGYCFVDDATNAIADAQKALAAARGGRT